MEVDSGVIPPALSAPLTAQSDQDAPARVLVAADKQHLPSPPATSEGDTSGHVSATTTHGSQACTTTLASPAANGGVGCRLLWRGSLTVPRHADGTAARTLHGVAIVASSFSLPSTSSSASPKFSSFSPSTFQEDPFASTSTSPSQFSSDADISLGLMMMRNASLKILGEIKVARADEGAPSHAQSSKSATKKGTASIARKGKGKNVDASPNGLVKVETPQDVRVYIDDRCPATCSWFQDMFCREGRQDCGVRLEMGGDEVIIFASLPRLDDSADSTPPPLTLLLGRAVRQPLAAPPPRPDDPLPRENLFRTQLLRQSASLPSFGLDMANSKKAKPLSASVSCKELGTDTGSKRSQSRTALGLKPIPERELSTANVGGNSAKQPGRRQQRSQSLAFESLLRPADSVSIGSHGKTGRTLVRSASVRASSSSTRNMFGATHDSRQSSLPPSNNDADLGRQRRGLKRSRSTAVSPLPHTRPREAGSPTPSLAGTLDGGEDDYQEEDTDAEAEAGERPKKAKSVGAKAFARSESAPAGKFLLSGTATTGTSVSGTSDQRRRREPSEAYVPSRSVRGMTATAEPDSIERRNKDTIRKLALSAIQNRGLAREDANFRDVFGMVRQGVGFALRNEMKDRLLVDELRTKAVEIVRLHAEMYLPLVAVAVASGLAVGADGAAHSDNGGGGGEEGSAVVKMEEG